MSSSNSVKCPICFKNFSSDFIETHAQQCNGTSSDVDIPPAKRIKATPMHGNSTHKFFSSKVAAKKKSPKEMNIKTPSFLPHDNFSSASRKANKPFSSTVPLAEKSRPATIEEYVGQEQVLGKDCVLNKLLKNDTVPSMILWGPPGCGKTSLAHVIAMKAKNNPNSLTRFVKLSATNSGKADVRAAVEAAKNERRLFKRKTILFIDEIHRFNKLQQDSFLPHVEDGTITLIGATTENPSFSLNSALLSRCRVIVLDKLSSDDVKKVLVRALEKFEKDVKIIGAVDGQNSSSLSHENDTHSSPDCEVIEDDGVVLSMVKITISDDAITTLAALCDGDARTALSGLQMAIQAGRSTEAGDNNNVYHIDRKAIKDSLHRSHVLYDRTGDQHYEMISAFQKSIRGSDDNATLYWLARMLEGGEDPKFISRRLIRIASEDIGLADSNALNLAISTQQACQFIGMPECNVVLAHCAVYMARAAKSVEVYMAYERAKNHIRNHEGPLPGVPLHLRNASTKLMKELGYGKGYQHKPPEDGSQTYLPDSLLHCNFFNDSLPTGLF